MVVISDCDLQSVVKETFEFAYNSGCAYIEAGNFEEAEKYLKLSQGNDLLFVLHLTLSNRDLL